MIRLLHGYVTTGDVASLPRGFVVVFGDNLAGRGRGGQAAACREHVRTGRAIGLPTKWLPSMDPGAFFSDAPDEIYAVEVVIAKIRVASARGSVVLVLEGIGSGRACLQEKAPLIWNLIRAFLHKHAGPPVTLLVAKSLKARVPM